MINHFLGIPEAVSAHGGKVDDFLELCHWFMLLLGIGWMIFFVYTIARFRKSKNPKADHIGTTSHTPTYLEVGVTIFDILLLFGFAIPLWAARVSDLPDEKKATNINVIAQQFAWNFHYPGADGVIGKREAKLVSEENVLGVDPNDPHSKDDITTQGEAHVPVNKPVIIHVTSKDVIHSLKIVQMRVCQDAIPGISIPLWFTPIKTGKYEILCAQLCGNNHYKMRAVLFVDSEKDFAEWQKKQAGGSATP